MQESDWTNQLLLVAAAAVVVVEQVTVALPVMHAVCLLLQARAGWLACVVETPLRLVQYEKVKLANLQVGGEDVGL